MQEDKIHRKRFSLLLSLAHARMECIRAIKIHRYYHLLRCHWQFIFRSIEYPIYKTFSRMNKLFLGNCLTMFQRKDDKMAILLLCKWNWFPWSVASTQRIYATYFSLHIFLYINKHHFFLFCYLLSFSHHCQWFHWAYKMNEVNCFFFGCNFFFFSFSLFSIDFVLHIWNMIFVSIHFFKCFSVGIRHRIQIYIANHKHKYKYKMA